MQDAIVAKILSEIEMEADFHFASIRLQCLPAGTPSRAVNQTTDRRDAILTYQVQRRLIDSRVQPEIIDTYADCASGTIGSLQPDARHLVQCPMFVPGGLIMFFFRRRTILFILVGSAAALTHFLTVVLIVERFALAPLKANVIGWLCAFGVSYGGHYTLTFADHAAPVLRSAGRFFVLSAAGFAINECSYAILLSVSALPYYFLLALILVAVAVLTYLLSRRWAFRGTDP